MEIILQGVQARLNSKVPELKYIDEDWGQLDYYYPNPPVKWPCSLIDATAATWSNAGNLQQLGLVQVKIRVADMKLTNSSAKAPSGQKTVSFSFFVLLRNIYKALHGWSGDESYTALIRTATNRVKREDGVRIYEVTFTTNFTDNSAVEQLETSPKPTLRFNVSKL